MVTVLTDLDELLLQSRAVQSTQYLREAIVAYRAGAYRASIISTWVAVCTDVMDKIRELAAEGDGAAVVLTAQMDRITRTENTNEMMAFERSLLTAACKELELISSIQKDHLERLRVDRNTCAHPTFSVDGDQFTPLPELVRSYIVQAATYLIHHPPVRGKVILERAMALVLSDSFPVNPEPAYTLLHDENYLGSVRATTLRSLIVLILKRLFLDEDGLDRSKIDRLTAALHAISRIDEALYSQVLRSRFNELLAASQDKQMKRFFFLLSVQPELWASVNDANSVRLLQCIEALTVPDMTAYMLVKIGSDVARVRQSITQRFEALTQTEKVEFLEKNPSIDTKEFAVQTFVGSRSFDSAYANGRKCLLSHVGFLNPDDLRTVLNGCRNNNHHGGINQILHAGGMDEILTGLFEETVNLDQHAEVWEQFWNDITDFHGGYQELQKKLIQQQYIEPVVKDNEDEDDDFPF